jgi:thioredoxin 1
MTEQLTRDTFLQNIFDYEKEKDWNYKGELPAIIDFWAPWCGPCRMVGPIIDELSEEFKGKVSFYKINTDEEQELSQAFGIRSIPSLLFIPKEGQPKMSVGAASKDVLVKAIEEELLNQSTA